MLAPKRGFLSFIKDRLNRLAIGQILREEYVYEVHGPFVAAASTEPRRGCFRQRTDSFFASIRNLAWWNHLRRRIAR